MTGARSRIFREVRTTIGYHAERTRCLAVSLVVPYGRPIIAQKLVTCLKGISHQVQFLALSQSRRYRAA